MRTGGAGNVRQYSMEQSCKRFIIKEYSMKTTKHRQRIKKDRERRKENRIRVEQLKKEARY